MDIIEIKARERVDNEVEQLYRLQLGNTEFSELVEARKRKILEDIADSVEKGIKREKQKLQDNQIQERIYRAHCEFRKNQAPPWCETRPEFVILGVKEYQELCSYMHRDCTVQLPYNAGTPQRMFMGMEVVQSRRESFLQIK